VAVACMPLLRVTRITRMRPMATIPSRAQFLKHASLAFLPGEENHVFGRVASSYCAETSNFGRARRFRGASHHLKGST
jgi:hypothetical protein